MLDLKELRVLKRKSMGPHIIFIINGIKIM